MTWELAPSGGIHWTPKLEVGWRNHDNMQKKSSFSQWVSPTRCFFVSPQCGFNLISGNVFDFWNFQPSMQTCTASKSLAFQRAIATLRFVSVSVWISHKASMGLVYLCTFTIRNKPFMWVCKYTIYGWYGYVPSHFTFWWIVWGHGVVETNVGISFQLVL